VKKIPQEYSRTGFEYKLVERDGDFAIYSVMKDSFKNYELVLVRRYKEDNDFVKVKAGDEYLPGPSEWGSYGWTLPTLAACHSKIKTLKEKYEAQNQN
jgi:hypothetical protein